jgi:hypothetical protein
MKTRSNVCADAQTDNSAHAAQASRTSRRPLKLTPPPFKIFPLNRAFGFECASDARGTRRMIPAPPAQALVRPFAETAGFRDAAQRARTLHYPNSGAGVRSAAPKSGKKN